MKKLLTFMITAVILAGTLAGCKDKTPEKPAVIPDKPSSGQTSGETSAVTPTVSGTVFDAGNVQALVPDGWKAFPQSDAFTDDPDDTDPDVISVCKGGETDLDLLTKPSVRIDYYGSGTEMMGGLEDWYDQVESLDPIRLGPYTWEGFITTDYGRTAILCAEDGEHQYQASVYLDVEGQTISLDDPDVQAILASVAPSDGTGQTIGGGEAAEDTAALDEWWAGDWYGWWCVTGGTAEYESLSDVAWDAYARIIPDGDGTARLVIWDSETSEQAPLAETTMIFDADGGEYGALTSGSGSFFTSGSWLDAFSVTACEISAGEWNISSDSFTVNQFDHMIELDGHYVNPDRCQSTFSYHFYLRPWGMSWEDVRTGDTSGCIYSDMMPLYYDNWYAPLVNSGAGLPDSLEAGTAVLQGGSAPVSGDKQNADGKVDMATLQRCLPWCKTERTYSTTYDEIAALFGVHGKSVESLFEGKTIYRWWADDDDYIQITFDLHEDGSETWNVTQWNGIQ
ncbi:MAG: hypothetical protein IKM31_11215 [Oscillospiraceae bacterium]|nr:hypothetical protein [Oscillospiraceae bacterium]